MGRPFIQYSTNLITHTHTYIPRDLHNFSLQNFHYTPMCDNEVCVCVKFFSDYFFFVWLVMSLSLSLCLCTWTMNHIVGTLIWWWCVAAYGVIVIYDDDPTDGNDDDRWAGFTAISAGAGCYAFV